MLGKFESVIYKLRSKVVTTQGAGNQNRQQDQEGNAINSQKEENITSNSPREDYTNLKGIYTAKAVVQMVFGVGVIYTAYSNFSLLPSSALIYLTGTLFDLIIATSRNKGPKYKIALVISKIFKWINIVAVAVLFFVILYRVDISGMERIVFWTIGIVMICLGIISSMVELILNRPNDD